VREIAVEIADRLGLELSADSRSTS
jgi:hypothetical protein